MIVILLAACASHPIDDAVIDEVVVAIDAAVGTLDVAFYGDQLFIDLEDATLAGVTPTRFATGEFSDGPSLSWEDLDLSGVASVDLVVPGRRDPWTLTLSDEPLTPRSLTFDTFPTAGATVTAAWNVADDHHTELGAVGFAGDTPSVSWAEADDLDWIGDTLQIVVPGNAPPNIDTVLIQDLWTHDVTAPDGVLVTLDLETVEQSLTGG